MAVYLWISTCHKGGRGVEANKMTKHFPAICTKHPSYIAYNKNGIGKHREISDCWEDFISIHSKAYKKRLQRVR